MSLRDSWHAPDAANLVYQSHRFLVTRSSYRRVYQVWRPGPGLTEVACIFETASEAKARAVVEFLEFSADQGPTLQLWHPSERRA